MTTLDQLSYLGRDFGGGEALRSAVAGALNEADGSVSKSSRLKVWLTAAAALVGTVDTTAPTVASIGHDLVYNKVLVNYNEGLDPEAVPAIGSFVISDPARTVTSVEVQGAQAIVSYSGVRLTAADLPLIAYTQPAADQVRLQNTSGVVAASFTAAAITVTP